jgi:hypothetical protein
MHKHNFSQPAALARAAAFPAIGCACWFAIYELGGAALIALVALAGAWIAIGMAWWLHTWTDRPHDPDYGEDQ